MNYTVCSGQHQRVKGESLETFVERIKPLGSELTHKVLTLTKWHAHQNVVLAFYATILHEQVGKEAFSQDLILGKLYLALKDSLYQEVLLDSLYGEGGTPKACLSKRGNNPPENFILPNLLVRNRRFSSICNRNLW
jgi:hypothetical protein